MTSTTWQRLFLFSRADTIYGGSDEIQRNIIADARARPAQPGPAMIVPAPGAARPGMTCWPARSS